MDAEPLIALEGAVAELGALYGAAKIFRPLQARAEAELLPQISALGARLRGLLRRAQLTESEIDEAAREILAIGSEWRLHLESVHASAVYREAVDALAADRQDDLARLLPAIFADLQLLRPAPTIYLGTSPSSGRRRPGSSPFLRPAECAAHILEVLTNGIVPEQAGGEWWEHELPFLAAANTAARLDTPIALQLAAADVRVAVFTAADDPGLRIFTPRLRAPFSIILAADAGDEWWEAYDDSYASFRDGLCDALRAAGQAVTIAPP